MKKETQLNLQERPAEYWIERIGMQPHPEGGWFAETYRSEESIPANALPQRFAGERAFATAIYFLLEAGSFSALHRIESDEMWHFYEGRSVLITEISSDGHLRRRTLGRDVENGEALQLVVPARSWFAAQVQDEAGCALVGCTVAPGFDFEDFELAERATLTERFPALRQTIEELCAK